MSRILVFGGCFDPIARHHLSVLAYVMTAATKGELRNSNHWVPAHMKAMQSPYPPFESAWILPYNKDPFGQRELAPIDSRIEMIERAIEDCDMGDYVQVSDFEEFFNIKCGRTKALLKFVKFYRQNDLVFLLGRDEAINLRFWKGSRKLTRELKFITVSRENYMDSVFKKDGGKSKYYFRPMSDWFLHTYNNGNVSLHKTIEKSKWTGVKIRGCLVDDKHGSRSSILIDRDVLTESVSDFIRENKLYMSGEGSNE
jgi:nicotinic acid mononucleotide adenylyltransferase